MADAFLALSLVAGWAYLLRPRLTMRQIYYRYFYLRSRHWRTLRREKIADVGYKCQRCKTRERLDVHHLTYSRLGHERLSDLKVLCRACHQKEHKQ